MITLFVEPLGGEVKPIEGEAGQTVMEIIRDHGFDDLLALCGGCCSCATCHVYVDRAFMDKLPPIADEERHLLESSSYHRPESRLSCQLTFSDNLDGLRVTIAPEG